MYHCTFCGAEIPEEARFCGNCGRTPISSPDGQTRISGFRRVELESVPGNMSVSSSQPGSAVSPIWEYDQSRNNDDASTMPLIDEDEERRRRAAMLGMGLLLGAEAIPGGSVPMVQGTPQIGGVPSVSNTPAVQGGLSGGHMPAGWHAGATNYMPHAPGYTPSVPPGSTPTHTWQHPPHPQQPPPKPIKPAPKGGCAPLLIVAILIPLIIIGSITTLGFTVFAPNLSLSGSNSVASGGTLALQGSHFIPGSSITLTLDNTSPVFVEAHQAGIQTAHTLNAVRPLGMAAAQLLAGQSASNTLNAGGDGTFSVNITIDPNWSTGKHTIQASESITHRGAELPFTIVSGNATPTSSPTVTPTVTPSPTLSPTTSPGVTPSPTVTATTPALSCVNPSSVALGPVSENYAQAVSTTITLCTSGAGSVNWTASWDQAKAPWLALDHSAGAITAPGQAQINVLANASQLAAGNYSALVTFSSQSSNVTESLSVNFKVQTGCINGSTNALAYNAVLHVSEAPPQTVSLTNCGAIGNWSASVRTNDGASWLSASPTGGTLGAGTPVNVTITASTLNSTLAAGVYSGKVVFTIGSGTFTVNVTFNVQAPPTISVTPTSLFGNISPCQLSANSGLYVCFVTVTNTSKTSSLTWTTSINLLPGLIMKPSGGLLAPGQSQPRILIEIPANDCASGAYILFSGPGNSVKVPWTCQVIG
jgi:zinc-ribbon domain/Viral BACON domain